MVLIPQRELPGRKLCSYCSGCCVRVGIGKCVPCPPAEQRLAVGTLRILLEVKLDCLITECHHLVLLISLLLSILLQSLRGVNKFHPLSIYISIYGEVI